MRFFVFVLFFCCSLNLRASNNCDICINGYLGNRIDECIEEFIINRDVSDLLLPFNSRNETYLWQSEFLGKWLLSAIDAYKYNPREDLFNKIKKSVYGLIATQDDEGYIGNYRKDHRFQQWDIWGMKYSLLSLISYYDITSDNKVLRASEKLANYIVNNIGKTTPDIVCLGNYKGMASSSILEPFVLLYSRTRNKKYLDFSKYIIDQIESERGPKLISKSLANIPVYSRFESTPTNWLDNGNKAYEMMSCYIGILEFYLVDKNPLFLKSVENVAKDIIKNEINIAGSGSAFECWYKGKENQIFPAYSSMETCVTVTWIDLCKRLFYVTHDSFYLDEIEKSIYNSLLASMSYDCKNISMYTPLEGYRNKPLGQCGMDINCCEANAPRGFCSIPSLIYQVKDSVLNVNMFLPSTSVLKMPNKNLIEINQNTDYPKNDHVKVELNPKFDDCFSLSIRIPVWSENISVYVNKNKITCNIDDGYVCIYKMWEKGDVVEIEFDLNTYLVENNHFQSLIRGPVVLARDSRFNDGFVDECLQIVNDDNIVPVSVLTDFSDEFWMSFCVDAISGTNLVIKKIHFCDFSSAGNIWDPKFRYKVWLPKTLDVQLKSRWK